MQGCQHSEELQCDGTVGFGASPNEGGHAALDAMSMHHLNAVRLPQLTCAHAMHLADNTPGLHVENG